MLCVLVSLILERTLEMRRKKHKQIGGSSHSLSLDEFLDTLKPETKIKQTLLLTIKTWSNARLIYILHSS